MASQHLVLVAKTSVLCCYFKIRNSKNEYGLLIFIFLTKNMPVKQILNLKIFFGTKIKRWKIELIKLIVIGSLFISLPLNLVSAPLQYLKVFQCTAREDEINGSVL